MQNAKDPTCGGSEGTNDTYDIPLAKLLSTFGVTCMEPSVDRFTLIVNRYAGHEVQF